MTRESKIPEQNNCQNKVNAEAMRKLNAEAIRELMHPLHLGLFDDEKIKPIKEKYDILCTNIALVSFTLKDKAIHDLLEEENKDERLKIFTALLIDDSEFDQHERSLTSLLEKEAEDLSNIYNEHLKWYQLFLEIDDVLCRDKLENLEPLLKKWEGKFKDYKIPQELKNRIISKPQVGQGNSQYSDENSQSGGSDSKKPGEPPLQAKQAYRRAISCLNGGDINLAQKFLEAAIDAAAKETFDFTEAITKLDEVLLAQRYKILRAETLELLKNGNYAEAQLRLEELKEKDPKDSFALQIDTALKKLIEFDTTWDATDVPEREKVLSEIGKTAIAVTETPLHKELQERLKRAVKEQEKAQEQNKLENRLSPFISLFIFAIIVSGFSLFINWEPLLWVGIGLFVFALLGMVFMSAWVLRQNGRNRK